MKLGFMPFAVDFPIEVLQYGNSAPSQLFTKLALKNRSVKRLLIENEAGSGKAQILEKPSELSHLLWVASQGQNGIRNRLIIWMLFGSGLRINELAHLKIRDVITPSGEIEKIFSLPASYTKTNKSRAVFIQVSDQLDTLNEWLQKRIDSKAMVTSAKAYRGLNPDSHLILFCKGRTWRNPSFANKKYKTTEGEFKTSRVCGSLENLARELIKGSGIHFGSSHSGRRTMATWFDRKGYSLELIQMILGHESPDMSLEYIEPWKKRIDDAFKKTLGSIKPPKVMTE